MMTNVLVVDDLPANVANRAVGDAAPNAPEPLLRSGLSN